MDVNIRKLFKDTDRLLRGQFTRREDLVRGRIRIPVRTLLISGASLGAVYGLFMGLYALFRPDHVSIAQVIATMFKVPLLFLLTLGITFPSLYVFSALARCRLNEVDTLRLLLGAITVNMALLASFGPVTGFFTLSTTSYAFMKVLNVIFFTISGVAGLIFLRRALDSVFVGQYAGVAEEEPPESSSEPESSDEDADPDAVDDFNVADDSGAAEDEGDMVAKPDSFRPTPGTPPKVPRWPEPRSSAPPAPPDRTPRKIFAAWTVMYAVVGAQMGWILRPFIGSPDMPFELFRERQSNFFQAIWRALLDLF